MFDRGDVPYFCFVVKSFLRSKWNDISNPLMDYVVDEMLAERLRGLESQEGVLDLTCY